MILLVPLAPGGASDIAARAFGTRLAERSGQPVVVENPPRRERARIALWRRAAQAANIVLG